MRGTRRSRGGKLEVAKRAEQEAATATTRAQEVGNRTVGARDSVAAATPPPPARGHRVNSRPERPGDDAFLNGSVTFMASSACVEFFTKLRAAVVGKASDVLTSVKRTSLHTPELLSVRQAWSTMTNSSWQGQLRAAPTLDLVAALRMAHVEAPSISVKMSFPLTIFPRILPSRPVKTNHMSHPSSQDVSCPFP